MTSAKQVELTLAQAAVMGTNRVAPPELPASNVLSNLLSSTDIQQPEKRLLDTAAFLHSYLRAGRRADLWNDALITPAPDDMRPVCSERAQALFRRMLSGEHRQVLPEALQMLQASGRRLPHVLLPELLNLASRQNELSTVIQHVAGPRGIWLAGLNDRWAYAKLGFEILLASDVEIAAYWSNATPAGRTTLFPLLRTKKPDLASSLVQSVWKTETNRSRLDYLKQFHLQLSAADEPFLSDLLNDKSKDTVQSAIELLTRIPSSTAAAYVVKIAEQLLFPVRNIFGQVSMAVVLPLAYEDEWKRFGVEPQSWINGISDRAWWFIQWISLVPPSRWNTLFNETPERLFSLAGASEYKAELHLAWTKASSRFPDPLWKYTALKNWAISREKRTTITALLPDINDITPIGELLIMDIMGYEHEPLYDGSGALTLLLQLNSPWTDELSLQVFENLCRRLMLTTKDSNKFWQINNLLKKAATCVSPTLNQPLANQWPQAASAWVHWAPAVQEFHELLTFRAAVHVELTS